MFGRLVLKSLFDRKGSVLLSMVAMTVSVFVLLGVEHIRHQAKESFSNTVSGVDLIVGTRTGSINLLLYSVFRLGAPTNNISWSSFKDITSDSNVKWAIPISLGDSHKGFRVMGTTIDYFKHYRYGKKHNLTFKQGIPFAEIFEVVLGYNVAKKLGYQLDDKLVLAHGVVSTSFSLHDDLPFRVVGILAPTGTPIDQTLHVSLEGIEAIHTNWKQGIKIENSISRDNLARANLEPKSITAFMLGLNSRIGTFNVQRFINSYSKEPLLAILPGVALSELWQMVGILENTLLLISVLVFFSACLGVSATLLSSMRERRQEIQLLRVIGAPPIFIFLLIEFEALLITVVSIIIGSGVLSIFLFISKSFLVSNFGLHIDVNFLTENAIIICSIILLASICVATIPSYSGYLKATNN